MTDTTDTETKTKSTVVATREPRAPLGTGAAIPKPLAAQDVDGWQRLASVMAASTMLPLAYTHRSEGRGQDRRMVALPKEVVIGNLVTAFQFGAEVGLTPAQSVWSIAIINGLPYMWGEAPLGLVYASGQLEWIKETWEGEDQVGRKDDKGNYLQPLGLRAICEVKRKNQPVSVKRSFSWAEAELAGLVEKGRTNWNPGMYMQYSRRMLQMRARGWALDDAFADVLKGIRSLADQEHLMRVIQGELTVEDAPPRPKRADYAKPETTQIAHQPEQPLDTGILGASLTSSENVPETVASRNDSKTAEQATQRTQERPSEQGEKINAGVKAEKKPKEQPRQEKASKTQPEPEDAPSDEPWAEVANLDGEPTSVADVQEALRLFVGEINKAHSGKDIAALMQWNTHWLGKLDPITEAEVNDIIVRRQDELKRGAGRG